LYGLLDGCALLQVRHDSVDTDLVLRVLPQAALGKKALGLYLAVQLHGDVAVDVSAVDRGIVRLLGLKIRHGLPCLDDGALTILQLARALHHDAVRIGGHDGDAEPLKGLDQHQDGQLPRQCRADHQLRVVQDAVLAGRFAERAVQDNLQRGILDLVPCVFGDQALRQDVPVSMQEVRPHRVRVHAHVQHQVRVVRAHVDVAQIHLVVGNVRDLALLAVDAPDADLVGGCPNSQVQLVDGCWHLDVAGRLDDHVRLTDHLQRMLESIALELDVLRRFVPELLVVDRTFAWDCP